MKRLLIVALAVLASALVATSSAKAVMWGEADTANQYSWVGLMVAQDEDGAPLWRCTGSLISPTVFLTAAHCTEGAANAVIWFSPGPVPLGEGYPASGDNPCEGITGYPCTGDASGEPIPHPAYDDFASFPNTRDIGVVILDEPVSGPYGVVAPLGTLDSLATQRGRQNTRFTVVGYGLQSVVPRVSAERTRYVGTVQLNNLRSALTGGVNLAHSGAPGKGTGGSATCFGDSGGPVLYESQIVAVTSFGLNNVCKGPGFAYRMDIAESRDWVMGFVE